MEDTQNWTFPKNINIENVSEYVAKFKRNKSSGKVIFDLTKTEKIHSSFIGFLIHVKDHMKRKNGKVTLILSNTVEKILIMLDILDYFTPEIVRFIDRKSA